MERSGSSSQCVLGKAGLHAQTDRQLQQGALVRWQQAVLGKSVRLFHRERRPALHTNGRGRQHALKICCRRRSPVTTQAAA